VKAGQPDRALACIDAVLPAQEKAVRTEQQRLQTAAKDRQRVEPLQGGGAVSLQFVLRNSPLVADRSLQRDWATLLACRGAALLGADRRKEAAEAIRQSVGITTSLILGSDPLPGWPRSLGSFPADVTIRLGKCEPCYLYDLACRLALASTLPGEPGSPDPSDQALSCLRCLVLFGFDNSYKLRTDVDLDPLRKHPDFPKLVRDLESRDRVGNAPARNH
jgi:hypothetical protein